MMEQPKQGFDSDFFMEIFMLGAWWIWKERNDTICHKGRATFQEWKQGFVDEALLQANRLNPDKQSSFSSIINLYK
jgi:hypothetical protein